MRYTLFRPHISLITILSLLSLALFSQIALSKPMHGIAMHGDLKYGEDFTHFDYTNPNAPKGGTLKLGVVGDNFDSFNPFIIKGVAASGSGYLYQSLTTHSEDEAFSEYGLIAERIEIPEDRTSVTFYLNPKAKFSDGTTITSEDVKFSFDTLTKHEKAKPFYSAYYGDVKEVKVTSNTEITFIFKNNQNKELPLILGQMVVLSKKYWEENDFGAASLNIPVGNGPYIIESFEPGRSVTLKRNSDYWAKTLPANKGKYNFDQIIFEYYKDNTIALEAFKAGEYDYRMENTARNWANAYNGAKFDSGELIKEEVKHERPAGMQGFVFNTRRKLFSDSNVRKALGYAFDFEWTNQNLFNSQYTRSDSYFENSELASSGLPEGLELKILKKFEKQLNPSVFNETFIVPTTKKPNSLRKNMRQAIKLLKTAGWNIKNNQLTHSDGSIFTFEFLLYSKDFERVVQPFIKNLKKLGIEASIRIVDTTQYINRRRSFDFDVMVSGYGQSNSPGNEQREYWHSSKASQQGSRNLAGIHDPVIDQLVDLIISAPTRDDLIHRTRALDRVLLHGHYLIPNWFNPVERISYSNKLKRPAITPKTGTSIDTWWINTK